MDGLAAPFILDRGLWQGVLSLLVLEGESGPRAYGLQVTCEAHMACSTTHLVRLFGGQRHASSDGVVLQEAEQSSLLAAYRLSPGPPARPRHFLLVGTNATYETMGFRAPLIRAFESREAAYDWTPGWNAF